jgi:hypothetical protein
MRNNNMKQRPRRIENKVAEYLSNWYVSHGATPVERQPIIGRTGPDITVNELGIVLDAKSRLQCPASFHIPAAEIIQFSNLIGVRLQDLDLLLTSLQPKQVRSGSIMVAGWWNHMDEWRHNHLPDGITAIVLHWPGKRVENATFLIRKKDREVLNERFNSLRPDIGDSPVHPPEGTGVTGSGDPEPGTGDPE